MDASDPAAATDLPAHRGWEKFSVVYVGNGIALHNAVHNRFVRMTDGAIMDASDPAAATDLPATRAWWLIARRESLPKRPDRQLRGGGRL